jgi:hypothetical protein
MSIPLGRRDAAGRSGRVLGGRGRRRESASLNLARLSRACLLFDCTADAVGGEPVGRSSGGLSRQAICLSAALTDRGMSVGSLVCGACQSLSACREGLLIRQKSLSRQAVQETSLSGSCREKRQNCAIPATYNLQKSTPSQLKKEPVRAGASRLGAALSAAPRTCGVLRGASAFSRPRSGSRTIIAAEAAPKKWGAG